MARVSLRDIRQMREFILDGFPAKEIAILFGVSETTVRNYTKAERKRHGEALQKFMRAGDTA